MADDLSEVQTMIREFARGRDWEQFHTPKNLAMALGGEAGELLSVLQWSDSSLPDQETLDQLQEELADVFIYAIRLADVCEIDLLGAARTKIASNERRYPIEKFRGSAAKAPHEDCL